jgi:hypothetical protein
VSLIFLSYFLVNIYFPFVICLEGLFSLCFSNLLLILKEHSCTIILVSKIILFFSDFFIM